MVCFESSYEEYSEGCARSLEASARQGHSERYDGGGCVPLMRSFSCLRFAVVPALRHILFSPSICCSSSCRLPPLQPHAPIMSGARPCGKIPTPPSGLSACFTLKRVQGCLHSEPAGLSSVLKRVSINDLHRALWLTLAATAPSAVVPRPV